MSAVLGPALGLLAGLALALARSRRRSLGLLRAMQLLLHECNGPMTALLLSLHGAERAVGLDIALSQARRLRSLLGDLDDYVTLKTSGRSLSQREPIALRLLAEGPVLELSAAFERAQVPLAFEPPPSQLLVLADRERAQRAFGSLLVHALRFRVSGPVRVAARGTALRVEYLGGEDPALLARSLRPDFPAERGGMREAPSAGILGLTAFLLERQGASLVAGAAADGGRVLTVEFPPAGAGA